MISNSYAPTDELLDTLFRAEWRRLRRFVRRLGVLESDLDDVVQDVFLIAHSRRAAMRTDEPASAWLFTIARHVARNHRRSVVRRGREHALADADDICAPGPSPFAAAACRQEALSVSRALAALPATTRALLLSCELEGLTPAEIASRTGASSGAVRVQLHRARRALQSALPARPAEAHGERPVGPPRRGDSRTNVSAWC